MARATSANELDLRPVANRRVNPRSCTRAIAPLAGSQLLMLNSRSPAAPTALLSQIKAGRFEKWAWLTKRKQSGFAVAFLRAGLLNDNARWRFVWLNIFCRSCALEMSRRLLKLEIDPKRNGNNESQLAAKARIAVLIFGVRVRFGVRD